MIGVPLMLGGFLTKGSMEPLKLLASLTLLRHTNTLKDWYGTLLETHFGRSTMMLCTRAKEQI